MTNVEKIIFFPDILLVSAKLQHFRETTTEMIGDKIQTVYSV